MKHRIRLIDYPYSHRIEADVLKTWILEVLHAYNARINRLVFHFVDEALMLKINQKHLDHHTHTDIITFHYNQDGPLETEIFISYPRLEENALSEKQSVENELLRLVSHGLLHCLSYNDKTDEEKQQMRKEEQHCIRLFHVKHTNHHV